MRVNGHSPAATISCDRPTFLVWTLVDSSEGAREGLLPHRGTCHWDTGICSPGSEMDLGIQSHRWGWFEL